MAKSSLIVTTEDHTTGNTQQKTITDINPQANDAHLKTWGQMVAGLSKDSYVKSDRVDKRNLDTDSKPDYNVIISTTKIDMSTGNNGFGAISNDASTVDINVTPYASGGTINLRLRNLTPYTAPYYTEITVNSAEGTVENRSILYCTDTFQTTNMRLLWTMDLTLIGTFAAGDSITVNIKVNEDSTHNAYTRTLTYNLVEWTSGGEG
ncbi:MAG: hypothetical protein IKD73_09470 [Selenomonadaceae bacterium]|nr:hypothetical protein [Selenomonadaceae bacterium]